MQKKNHIRDRVDSNAVLVPNFPANNFRITMGHPGRSYSEERENDYQQFLTLNNMVPMTCYLFPPWISVFFSTFHP